MKLPAYILGFRAPLSRISAPVHIFSVIQSYDMSMKNKIETHAGTPIVKVLQYNTLSEYECSQRKNGFNLTGNILGLLVSLLSIFLQPTKLFTLPSVSANQILYQGNPAHENEIPPTNTSQNLINHIAIVPDGNRRWARLNGFQPWKGHFVSQKIINEVLKTLWTRGIHTITVWFMSPENFNRPADELHELWNVFEIALADIKDLAAEFNARFHHVGNKGRLPPLVNQLINSIEEETKDNTARRINLAIDYSGREDILRAMSITKSEQPHDIGESLSKNLWGGDQPYPEPDLIVRTGTKDSKTVRMSGFMIWQSVYSELLFVDKYMPEVTEGDVDAWIESFNRAERRFGK